MLHHHRSRYRRTFAVLAVPAVAAFAALGAVSAASAGTYTGQPGWTLQAPSTDSFSAQVQQPINADGSSVFSHKSSTIPVQFKVTDTQSYMFESVISGDSGATPAADTAYSVASYTMPPGVTVADINNLTADFTWPYGENHSGGFRWQVGVQVKDTDPTSPTYGQLVTKNIMVDYGDASTTMQTGTGGSGVNMVNSTLAAQNRDESSQVGGTMYTPWSYVQNNFGNLPVTEVDLVLDGGWGTGQTAGTHDQVINLTDATVGYTGGSSTFTMPGSLTTQTNSAPAWIYLDKTSGVTTAPIDETTLTSTQGDTGGQFRQVDGKYIYNLPVNDLQGASGDIWKVGISFTQNGSPVPSTVKFALK
jgi:hypothetical protein